LTSSPPSLRRPFPYIPRTSPWALIHRFYAFCPLWPLELTLTAICQVEAGGRVRRFSFLCPLLVRKEGPLLRSVPSPEAAANPCIFLPRLLRFINVLPPFFLQAFSCQRSAGPGPVPPSPLIQQAGPGSANHVSRLFSTTAWPLPLLFPNTSCADVSLVRRCLTPPPYPPLPIQNFPVFILFPGAFLSTQRASLSDQVVFGHCSIRPCGR